MNTKIKICGLTRAEDIAAVNKFLPDYIGFVFAESRRRVTFEQARELRAALCEKIIPVGVFVNESHENILRAVNEKIIDAIQLHGDEDENFILYLKEKTSAPIIKAVSVREKGDAQAWENSAADFLLLDHKGGGTGEAFDWEKIGARRAGRASNFEEPAQQETQHHENEFSSAVKKQHHENKISPLKKNFFLAGGLNSQNICDAIKKISPFAVDTSSGVEISPGIKCAEKIQKFINQIR